MSTNPNTKTYWRRVSRLTFELEFQLTYKHNDKPVTDIIAAFDPKATRTMHCEAIKMAIERCSRSECSHTESAEQCRMAHATLLEFREPISLRVIDGGKL